MRVGRRHLSGVEVNISVVKTNPQRKTFSKRLPRHSCARVASIQVEVVRLAVDEVDKRVVKLSSSSISYQNMDIGPHHHHQRYHSLSFFSPPHGKNVSPHRWGWSMLSSRIMDVRR